MNTEAKYRWIIEQDIVTNGECVGVQGPSNLNLEIVSNPTKFELYDDDGELYARGTIFGDYDGFEPLDDFGEGNWGCTGIKYGGKWL
jgi:hypothetical protein